MTIEQLLTSNLGIQRAYENDFDIRQIIDDAKANGWDGERLHRYIMDFLLDDREHLYRRLIRRNENLMPPKTIDGILHQDKELRDMLETDADFSRIVSSARFIGLTGEDFLRYAIKHYIYTSREWSSRVKDNMVTKFARLFSKAA